MNETFWMVWCMDRAAAHKRHSTQASAIAEATRIAQKEKKPAHVLMSIGQAVPQDPPVVWIPAVEPTPALDETIYPPRDCGKDREYSNGFKTGFDARNLRTPVNADHVDLSKNSPLWIDGYKDGWTEADENLRENIGPTLAEYKESLKEEQNKRPFYVPKEGEIPM